METTGLGRRPRRIVVVGAGNIGSQLLPHLARTEATGDLLVVDYGRYDASNLVTQAIASSAVGKLKAQVQAQYVGRINPGVRCRAIAAPVETVPLGLLRADVIVACVDRRATRQYLNEAARHLGATLIDTGVMADNRLVRVAIYHPDAGAGCLECSWSDADYAVLEQEYPCHPEVEAAPSTGATAPLGALAAALAGLAIEDHVVERQTGVDDAVRPSRELVFDASSNRALQTTIPRSRHCRLGQHEPWDVERLDEGCLDLALDDVLAICAKRAATNVARMVVPGMHFIERAHCLRCGRAAGSRPRFEPIGIHRPRCRWCGGRVNASGQHARDAIAVSGLAPALAAHSLRRLGLRPGDVIGVDDLARRRYFVLSHEKHDANRRPSSVGSELLLDEPDHADRRSAVEATTR